MKMEIRTLLAAISALFCGFLRMDCCAGGMADFPAANYGAVPDDGKDDRAAIQAALDAAEAAGGGRVVLDAGIFDIWVVTIVRGPLAGAQGVMLPAGCELSGAGMLRSTLLLHATQADVGLVGNGIVNKGYTTATVDYGAAGDMRVRDLGIETPSLTSQPMGNLIGIGHCDGAIIERVRMSGSRHHALEINRSRNVVARDCLFDGQHPGTSTVQLDFGAMGAISNTPTTKTSENILFERCRFQGREAEIAPTPKVVELNHTNGTMSIRNVTFRGCWLDGSSGQWGTTISFDNPGPRQVDNLLIEDCVFYGRSAVPNAYGLINLPQSNSETITNGVIIRRCRFEGQFWQGIVVGSAYSNFTTDPYRRKGIVIEDNRFLPTLDRESPANGGNMLMIAAAACQDVAIRRNLIEFPATTANLYISNSITPISSVNSLRNEVSDNIVIWNHSAESSFLGPWMWTGVMVQSWRLEQAGIPAYVSVTGNRMLCRPGAITNAINMSTGIGTTAWAPGAPWVSGLIAGNYCSGSGVGGTWAIHHDLSDVGDVSKLAPQSSETSGIEGWYPCNGAALATLDQGLNQIPRFNATKMGLVSLPTLPGKVLRLRGPLTGEGILAGKMQHLAGGWYAGPVADLPALTALPSASLRTQEIRLVRSLPDLYIWRADLLMIDALPGSLEPNDKIQPGLTPGVWERVGTRPAPLQDLEDPDHDGASNLVEWAFLGDPFNPESAPNLTRENGGIKFSCSNARRDLNLRVEASNDLVTWTQLAGSDAGGPFTASDGIILSELAGPFSRAITVIDPMDSGRSRHFWRVQVSR